MIMDDNLWPRYNYSESYSHLMIPLFLNSYYIYYIKNSATVHAGPQFYPNISILSRKSHFFYSFPRRFLHTNCSLRKHFANFCFAYTNGTARFLIATFYIPLSNKNFVITSVCYRNRIRLTYFIVQLKKL